LKNIAFLNAIQIPWNVQIITFNSLKMFVVEIRLLNGLNWEGFSSEKTRHMEMHAGIWHEITTYEQTV
jgi:hypothetical protein